MKKLVATLCIAGSVIGLSACESTGQGNVETAAPYASERTAGYGNEAVPEPRRSERVFRDAQSK
jgi:hypothetical protein